MGTGNMTTVELVIPSPTKLVLFSTFLDLASVLPKQDCSYMKTNKVTSCMNIYALVEV